MKTQLILRALLAAALMLPIAPEHAVSQLAGVERVEFPARWSSDRTAPDSATGVATRLAGRRYDGNRWKAGAKIGAVAGGILLALASASLCRMGEAWNRDCTFAPVVGLATGALFGGLLGALFGGMIPAD